MNLSSKYCISFISTAFCLTTLLCSVKTFADNASNNIDQNLSQLEDKFFEHTYAQDNDTDRLNRLEQFIFGSTQSGSTEGRLQHILDTVPAQSPDNTNKTESTNTTPVKETPESAANTNETNNNSNNPFDYTNYPRVNTLEQELLGQTYPNDSLPQRLTRLETKAFGKTSDSTDLAQRVDLLDDYVDRHDLYGEHSIGQGNAPSHFDNQDYFNSASSEGTTSTNAYNFTNRNTSATGQNTANQTSPFIGQPLQLVSIMEAQVFDHTYPNHPLTYRVKKLEKKVFNGKTSNHINLSDRIAKLWNALHPQQAGNGPELSNNQAYSANAYNNQSLGTSNSNPNKTHHSWLHKLGSVAGSVATGLAMPMSYGNYGYGMGMSGMGYGMSMPSYGMSGYGMPSMGYGMGMPGYGYGMPYGGMGYGGMFGSGMGRYW